MIAMLSIYISVDRGTQKMQIAHCKTDIPDIYLWAMPEVQQTVAMLPVCVLPEAMLLLFEDAWCFGD